MITGGSEEIFLELRSFIIKVQKPNEEVTGYLDEVKFHWHLHIFPILLQVLLRFGLNVKMPIIRSFPFLRIIEHTSNHQMVNQSVSCMCGSWMNNVIS